MLIERSTINARRFNLSDADSVREYNDVINDPSTRVLDKKFINHTESVSEGDSFTETKEVHVFLEWEVVCL